MTNKRIVGLAGELIERSRRDPLDLFSFALNAVTLFLLPTLAIASGDLRMTAYSFFVALLVTVWVFRNMRARRDPPRPTELFTGVQPLDTASSWPRNTLAHEVFERLLRAQHEPAVFSGPSGAGKSVLFATQLTTKLTADGWTVIRFDDYRNIRKMLSDKVIEVTTATLADLDYPTLPQRNLLREGVKAVFIFDQFEQVIEQTAIHPWLRGMLTQLLADRNVRIALIVRQEFYYGLRFLGALIPAPTDVEEFPGLDVADQGEAIRLLPRLAEPKVVDSLLHEIRDANGRILPLELQVAGEALERISREHGGKLLNEKTFRELGGNERSLFREYFAQYIASAPHPDLAPAVLFAVAIVPPGRGIDARRVADITYASHQDVAKVLDHFREQRILAAGSGEYHWTHESLAAMYRDSASTEMETGIRETILYRATATNGGMVRDAEESRRGVIGATVIFTIMVAGIMCFVGRGLIDLKLSVENYVLVAPAHVAWALFVYRMTRDFFVRLRSRIWYLLAVAGATALGLTMYEPTWWILSMGLIGATMGGMLVIIGGRKEITTEARKHFRRMAANFMIVGGAIMMLGGVAFHSLAAGCREYAGWFPLIEILLCAGFVALASTSVQKYTGRGPATVWLALADRR